jgi:hypothetical protein
MKIYILKEVYKGHSTIKVIEATVSNTNGKFYAYTNNAITTATDSSFYEEYEFATSLEEAKTKIEKFCKYKFKQAQLEADNFAWIADMPIQDFEFV